MGTLEDWDFGDEEKNATISLINRQKSAMEIEFVEFDPNDKIWLLWDKRNGPIEGTITSCECKDFNYAGNSKRKKFAPCMHIYRIAIETGLMKSKYLSTKYTRASERVRNDMKDKILAKYSKDPDQWGGWDREIHKADRQIERQHRAYGIFLSNDHETKQDATFISGYHTTLERCGCRDFEVRNLPCKHIYCAALTAGHKLLISEEDYLREEKRRRNGFVPIGSISLEFDEE